MKKTKGFSILGAIVAIAVVGFVMIYGVQVGFGYMNAYVIKRAAKAVLASNKQNGGATTRSIESDFWAKISSNDIDISREDVEVTQDGDDFQIVVNYQKSIKVNSNIQILMDFEIDSSN